MTDPGPKDCPRRHCERCSPRRRTDEIRAIEEAADFARRATAESQLDAAVREVMRAVNELRERCEGPRSSGDRDRSFHGHHGRGVDGASEDVRSRGPTRWRLTLAGMSWPLEPGRVYSVGRDPRCDIVVSQRVPGADTVSRFHALVSVTERGVCIEELGSRNGTWIGRRFIRPAGQRVELREAEELQLGDVLGELAPLFLMLDASPLERPLSSRQRLPVDPRSRRSDSGIVRIARVWRDGERILRVE